MAMAEVTEEDMRLGIRKDKYSCPIFRATSRLVIEDTWVTVDRHSIFLHNYQVRGHKSKTIKLPIEAKQFIKAFDNALPVSPITFPLDIPDRFLKSTTP